MKKKTTRLSTRELLKKGIPMVLIPGLVAAMALGWNGDVRKQAAHYTSIQQFFSKRGIAITAEDGDTFVLQNGVRVRLLGINTPERGDGRYSEAKDTLATLIVGEKVYLEYDRYMDDKYGRLLAWVWVNCETTPTFLPTDYMHLTGNTSRPGLKDNPKGCAKGKLVNEELVHAGMAKTVAYKDRGPLKYEARLMGEFR